MPRLSVFDNIKGVALVFSLASFFDISRWPISYRP